MNCRNCGADISPGSAFCTQCGQRTDAAPVQQPPSSEQPQPYAQPHAGQPYGQPPAAPQPAPKKPLGKGMKALIFGGVGVAVLAVVLVLVFTLGGGKPFSGNTIQTKFANELVRFGESVSGDFPKLEPVKLLNGPFEVELDASVGTGYSTQDVSIAAVYDKRALGVLADSGYGPEVMLIRDGIIMTQGDRAKVYEADTKADLDKDMPLSDRLAALAGAKKSPDVNYLKLAEMFINSIPEECFRKTGSSFTMTLDTGDLADTLEAFAAKLEKEPKLNEAFEDVLDAMGSREAELSELVEELADMLGGGFVAMEVQCELVYEGGRPVALRMNTDAGYTETEMEIRIEGADIAVAYETRAAVFDYDFSAEMELLFTRVGKGYDFEGSVDSGGERGTLEGHIYRKGSSIELVLKGESADGESISLEADITLSYDMPKKAVEKDRRFDIDTEDADTYDLEDLF